jgi:hypothetical protein
VALLCGFPDLEVVAQLNILVNKNLILAFLFLPVGMTVILPAQTITTQPTNQVVLVGGNATFSVMVSNTGPFYYQWQFNSTNLPNYIITTVAGGGTPIYPSIGDGGAATNASINSPYGVAVDAVGNLYIADTDNNLIRKVSAKGIITTVAGSGAYGFSGDGAAATNASLGDPYRVAVDALGNLFIADSENNRIRKVDTNGIITTVAGSGILNNGFMNFYGDGGEATNAGLSYPSGVAVDGSGNFFIADQENQRIRKVSTNGVITTVAGNGTGAYSGDGNTATSASLYWPSDVAVDAIGNLFIADSENNRIRKVSTNGIITTVAGGGAGGGVDGLGDGAAATNASSSYPNSVAVDTFGNLFIADVRNQRIREVNASGIITTVAGFGYNHYSGDGGPATSASLSYPEGVGVDVAGNFFIADAGNNRIRKVVMQEPTFVIYNVTTNNAGNYRLIISGTEGSVTSSVVTLTLTLPPLTATRVASNSLQLQLSGIPSSRYVLQAATNIIPPMNWQPVFTNLADANGNWFFTNANVSQYPLRFYRVSQ